jgi:hypothetical protein
MNPQTISASGAAADVQLEASACPPSAAVPEALQAPATAKVPRAVLSPDEARELDICEGLIEEGLSKSVGVALALVTVRDKRLYRESFDTFEEYVESRWGVGVRQAQRLCVLANFTKSLENYAGDATPGSHLVLPSNEKQVRALNRLPSEAERISAWREACRVAAARPGGKPTAKEVERVVDGRLGVGRDPGVANGQLQMASGRAVDVQPVGNRAQRALEVLRRAIATARDLVDTLGTADSVVTARAALTLEQLQAIGDHLSRVERLQAARANGERGKL